VCSYVLLSDKPFPHDFLVMALHFINASNLTYEHLVDMYYSILCGRIKGLKSAYLAILQYINIPEVLASL